MEEKIIYVKIIFYGDDTVYYYPIYKSDLLDLNIDENNDYYEEKDSGIIGFFDKNNNEYITDDNTENFEVVTFEKEKYESNYYGTGYDRVVAKIEGYNEELVKSRWSGSTGYYKRIQDEE